MGHPDMVSAVELDEKATDFFVTSVSPWLPTGAQAIYGGTFIAHALVASQKTVETDVVPLSIQCTFLIGGSADVPLEYRVKRISDDLSSTIRQVRAFQYGKCIFIATVAYNGDVRAGPFSVSHPPHMPPDLCPKLRLWSGGMSEACPFVCSDVYISTNEQSPVEAPVARQWMKSRDLMSNNSDRIHHLAALAYMSDNYLLPTASRLMNMFWDRDPEYLKGGQIAVDSKIPKGYVDLMLTLNHRLCFYNIRNFRADHLMMAEMRTLAVGDRRALTEIKVFGQDQELIGSAQQEGIFRLQQSDMKL